MAIPLMQKKMFHGFNFFSRKKLVKLYVKLVFASPKFPNFLGSFFSASSQADFASFFLLSKESNETFTNASHHLLVCGIALCSRQLRFNASSRPVQSTLKMFSNSKQRSGKALQTIADKEEMKFEYYFLQLFFAYNMLRKTQKKLSLNQQKLLSVSCCWRGVAD